MPKVLIREYDNSTTGIPASDNFAVVVPGYFGTPKTYKENGVDKSYEPDKGLWNASGVYEVKSQSDFVKYIGKRAGMAMGASGPVLDVPLYTGPTADEYSTYINTISVERFEKVLQSNGTEKVYKVEVLLESDPLYGTNSRLVKTIESYAITQKTDATTGELVYEDDGKTPVYEKSEDPTTRTVKLTEVKSSAELKWEAPTGSPTDSEADVCIIKAGKEGNNTVTEKHIGNQIAFELLGLGYTVLYKKLDDSPTTSATAQLTDPTFWEPLKDKSVFNFRYVMTGGCYEPAAMNQICQLATFNNSVALEEAETYDKLTGRGDCIALCDIKEDLGKDDPNDPNKDHSISSNLDIKTLITNIGYAAKQIQFADQYSAIFGPKVTYIMADDTDFEYEEEITVNGTTTKIKKINKEFPASFHYLACARRTFDRYNEWYAVAGYNRGISNYSIATTSVKLGEIAINTLAPRIANDYTTKSINLILHERGNYFMWGNRTGYALDNKGIVFHHFLNIRQLCCSIKKQLYTACRQFTFDPNSDLLWINFVNAIKPTLEAMRADQGIKGYTISRVANDKKALLTARIRIVPIEAVEDFDISIYLEDSLTGIVVSADEELA